MPKSEAAARSRVSRIYASRCSGIQINMMDIPRVFNVGMKAHANGGDDQAIGDAIAAFVETIRCN